MLAHSVRNAALEARRMRVWKAFRDTAQGLAMHLTTGQMHRPTGGCG